MENLGYFQLKASPGIFRLNAAKVQLYSFESVELISSFTPSSKTLQLKKSSGHGVKLNDDTNGVFSQFTNIFSTSKKSEETIHIFSLASGHLYERFL